LLVFDTTKIQNRWYGYDVFEKIIPLFDKKSNHSILVGDYVDRINNQNRLYSLLNNEVKFIKECTYKHSSQFFLVYLNNFSDNMAKILVESLYSYEPFVGSGTLNYLSPLKTYISFCLCNGFIKNGNKIIMSHEDDIDNFHNQNTLGYPFEKNGYKYFSLKQMLFISFLSYKIERKIFKEFKEDNIFSINTLTNNIIPLDDLQILVEKEKLDYLKSYHGESLKKSELFNITKAGLEKKIKEKISDNYIYNLTYSPSTATAKFNIILELKTAVKVLLSLEYMYNKKVLRLITMY